MLPPFPGCRAAQLNPRQAAAVLRKHRA